MKVVITARNYEAGGGIELLKDAGFEVEYHGSANLAVGAGENVVAALAGDADAVIAGLEPYSAAVLDACPNLKLISRRGIGYDSVDLEACRARGVSACRTTGAVEASVAESVMAYILYFARRVDLQSAEMHQGIWTRHKMPGAKTRTLGLVGFGGIGKETAIRANAMGMRVLYTCRHPRPEWEQEYHARAVSMEELLRESDYVTAAVPQTPQTLNMFNAQVFAQMKPGSVFINIARGPVMSAEDLRDAVVSGHLAGAAVDVYPKEPCTDSPLIGCPNVILTPHTATFTEETFGVMNRLAAENVIAWANGTLEEMYRLV